MAVVVREDRPVTGLIVALDGSGRYVGAQTREFTVSGLDNAYDEGASRAAILAASADGSVQDSVAGSSLAIGQQHPYFDGGQPDRPIARARRHEYVPVNATQAIFTVAYETRYAPAYGGAPETNASDVYRTETEHVTPVYYSETIAGETRYRPGAVQRKRVVKTRIDRFIVAPSDVNLNAEYAAAGKTFVLPDPGGGATRWLYLSASARDNPRAAGQKILTRHFWRTDALQAITPTADQPGLVAVPAVPALGMIEVARLTSSGPIYAVYDDAALYPDGGTHADLPAITTVINPFDDA